MKKRFVSLYESMLRRSTRGGYLVGDIVKFADNALKHDFIKSQSEDIKKNLENLIKGGNTLRVVNVISKYPAVGGEGNPDNLSGEYTVEVGEDISGGRILNSAVVSPDMIVRVDPTPNLEPVPTKNIRKNNVNIKPIPVKDEAEEVPFLSTANTKLSDVGGKLVKGDRELTNTNTKIPAMPVTGQKDPATYTANYLPKV